MTPQDEYGQPVGDSLPGWLPARRPGPTVLPGRYCTLEPLDPDRHAADLHAAYSEALDDRDWTYLSFGPFRTIESYRAWADTAAQSRDPRQFAVVSRATGRALGTLALMRQDPDNGVIEVGTVALSRALQRTPASTEAQYLLMRHVFEDLGYRRYEWKCDSLNAPSRRAALRLGFTYEGTFRQAVVYRGRNRDTAWYSMLDGEWPRARSAFERWLRPENFDAEGMQREPLQVCRR